MNNTEAQRCLLCKRPKCSLDGCPVHTPVPECMALYREGRLEEAGRLLFENNPLSAITSLVCDWKKFCFGHCVLNVKQVPVRWYEIEQEISGEYLKTHRLERSQETPLSGKSVALVGGGPVGISAAIFLWEKGADVTIYDANERLGGVLRYGIPQFRLDKAILEPYERMFAEAGIRFVGGTELGKDLTISKLNKDFDAVLIGTGAEKAMTLRVPGEDNSLVMQALPFLKNPDAYPLGKKVIIIGGGNVAMDACRTAVRLGAETWVYYRKTFENMPANPMEIEEAKADGVQFRVFQAPVEVHEHSVTFRDCENETDPETGKVSTRIIEGTDHEVECDHLILAISEKPDYSPLGDAQPQLDEWGFAVKDELQRLQIKGMDNIFSAGDFLLGPKTVVEAVLSAKTATENIAKYLLGA